LAIYLRPYSNDFIVNNTNTDIEN